MEFNQSEHLKFIGTFGESSVQVTTGMQNCRFGKPVSWLLYSTLHPCWWSFSCHKSSQLQLSRKKMGGPALVVQGEYPKNAMVAWKSSKQYPVSSFFLISYIFHMIDFLLIRILLHLTLLFKFCRIIDRN